MKAASNKVWSRKYYYLNRPNRVISDSWISLKSRSKDYKRLYRGATNIKMVNRKFPHRVPSRSSKRKRQHFNNAYLRPVKLPSKKIILWKNMKGTTGKWLYHIPLSDLIAPYTGTYDEFKIVNLRVTYKPDNATSADGLCAGILMDQNGFGDYGSASETAWFATLGSMPGAKIRPRFVTTTYYWKSTEPDSKQWRSYQRGETSSYIVATFYMADDGKESAEYGGILEISGLVLGRGRYYNAPTVQRTLTSSGSCTQSCSCCLKQMEIK